MTIIYVFNNYTDFSRVKSNINNYLEKELPACKFHPKNGKLCTYGFARMGIERMYLSQNISYTIQLRIRPQLMITGFDYDNIFNARDIPMLYNRFSEIMKRIGADKICSLKEWKVNRIDYAADIILDQELIPKYIELFKKGNIPEDIRNRETSKKYFNEGNNLYLKSTAYCINFYDRWTTSLLKQKKHPKKYNNIENRYGVMRFEVQLHNPNIFKLKKAGHIKNNTVEDFLNLDLARKYIFGHYKTLIGTGDYIEYNRALQKCKSHAQRKIIELVHDMGSIYKAKEVFINSGDDKRKLEKQFSSILQKLHLQGINPVTLKKGELKNLYPKIQYQIDNSYKINIGRSKVKHST